jgi:CelD/BcsL family acetyltransferase involved in cellulose biosynthesis
VWRSFAEAEAEVRPFLARLNENPFASWEWLELYHARFQHAAPLLVGVYRDAQIITFAALIVKRKAGLRTIGFLAEGRADINCFVGEVTAATVDAILNALPRAALRVADLRESDPLIGLLKARLPGLRVLKPYPNPARDLRAPQDSKSNRKFQARIPGNARRLAELGTVEHELIDFDGQRAAALALLPELWRIHDLRHAGRRNAWKFAANRAFLSDYIQKSERSGVLGFVLRLNGQPIAFDIGFRVGRRFLLYIPAFLSEYERFRPGHINRWLAFPKCAELGLESYDFSRGASFAKHVWATGEEWSVHAVNSRWLAWIEQLKIRGRESGLNARVGRALARLGRG